MVGAASVCLISTVPVSCINEVIFFFLSLNVMAEMIQTNTRQTVLIAGHIRADLHSKVVTLHATTLSLSSFTIL